MNILRNIFAAALAFIALGINAQTKFIASGGGAGSGGTVTSVAATVPAEITLTGSPITTTGTLAFSWASALQNKIFAAPSGGNGTPTFRVLVASDLPNTAVTPGSYTLTSLTVDAQGRITAASNGAASGAPFVDTTSIVEGSADATKELRIEVDGFTTGTVRVATPPNADFTMPGKNLTNTWDLLQTFTTSPTSVGAGANSERYGASATTNNATGAVAVGQAATVSTGANDGVAIGRAATATGTVGVAIGVSTSAAAGAVAIGNAAQSTSNQGVAIGNGAAAAGGVTIGWSSSATASNAVVVGTTSSSIGTGVTLIGGSITGGSVSNATAVGTSTVPSASSALLGNSASAGGFADCIALGMASTCTAANQTVIGNGSGHVSTSAVIAGWISGDGGKCYVASDQTNATTTMASTTCTISGLLTSTKYRFSCSLYVDNSLDADGAKIDFAGGTATETNFRAQVTVFDTALNLSQQNDDLTDVSAAATLTGNGSFEVHGSFEPSGAGTFLPRFAGNAAISGTLTLFRGSSCQMWVMP